MSEETKVQESTVEQTENTAETATPAEAVEAAAPVEAAESVEAATPVEAVEDGAETVDMNDVVMVKKGDTVRGKIVKIEDNQAYVDIGYKYDGIIPLRELSSISIDNAGDAVALGQEVECRVSSINDAKETLLLSKRAVDSVKAWDQLQALLDSGEVFEGVVADVVKGGLVVDVGVRGFIPASMVERHFVDDFSDYKGRTLRLKVKELDKENNKVILSQKDVLDAEFEAIKEKRMAELTVGEIIEGKVERLTNFGAFVDIGGVDGLVHVSEIAWSHVDKPADAVKEGEAVTVKVLKVDPQNDRISLSIKQAQPGPWELVDKNFSAGTIVEGVVKRLAAFGAFVEIAPGIEGLVHISQIAHRHIGTPHEVLKEGQTVQVKILEINAGEKRVSLSIKETEEAPPQPERAERADRRREPKETVIPEAYSNDGLSITLGERFGDKLSKFK